MKRTTNIGRSVRDKLLNLMKASGREYMYILQRYFNERLLYRVSVSRYRDNFLLKGGSLLYAIDGMNVRPTVDVDFMAMKINRDRESLTEVFKEILSIQCPEDGVTFDANTLNPKPITVDKKYPGTRFEFTASLDTIRNKMSIDIGFGDVVIPEPTTIDFPILIEGHPAVSLKAYSLETVIAEKFHAMIDRDLANSRMKDFFDCYQIQKAHPDLIGPQLKEAIYATFDNRQLVFNPDLKLFSEEFSRDAALLSRWTSFLRNIKWPETISFTEVMDFVNGKLKPFYEEYAHDRWQKQ